MKKHKACVSEFDYSGWEDFGKWKRVTTGLIVRSGSKHCEDECSFPSSCHWKGQHAVEETKFGFIDPSCLNNEPDTSSITGKMKVQRNTGNHIDKFGRTAEKDATQAAEEHLSSIEEEEQKTLWSLDTRPRLNGLGLHSPTMNFSSSKDGANESGEFVDRRQIHISIPKSPQMLARVENVLEEDVDMTDWITPNATEIPLISSCAELDSIEVAFDFGIEQDESARACTDDNDSPISPMRSAWNWTAGGIGIALSTPTLMIEEESGDEETMEESDDADMLWTTAGSMAGQR